MNDLIVKGLAILLMEFTFMGTLQAHGDHSIPCSGPHQKDPECEVVAATPSAVLINSARVDWLNEKIIVKGENFSVDTTVSLAGIPATIDSRTVDQLEIPFDNVIAGTPMGNHNLVVVDIPSSSSSSISLFVKAGLIDQALTGCPCETGWSTELGSLWNPAPKTTECIEITGGTSGPVEIAGTILSDPTDPGIYPHYPIGAAFSAEPNDSVCQLTQVNTLTPTVIDLVKIRINRLQQGDCRTALANNVCNTITPVP